ncbi:MAG TPA: uroporphyrinogen decarboxylase family protein [Acidobacteriota bacterium]|nr:uroporphyrinogen decarboxylase family protein [Acidobacteriota bacterium]
MTSRERMAGAMAGRTPDRVPVMCQMSVGHMLVATGVRPAALWHDAGTYVEALLALRRRYGFDGILVSLHGHEPGWERRVIGAEAGPAGERIRWSSGGATVFPADDLPIIEPDRPPVRPEFSRLDPASIPDTVAYIPVSQGLRFALDPEHLFDAVVDVLRRAGRDYSVHGEVTSALDYFLDLFGFERAMVGCLEDPGRAAAVLDRFATGVAGLAEGLAATGVDAIKISSPFAGAGFLSTAFYRTFVQPFERRIVRAIEARGVRAYIHTCGDIHDRLELMADSGASGIECLDPPPLGRVELAEAKARVGGRVFIKGNIDPVHVLLAGDRDAVRADAARRVAVGKPGGRYILSTACSIAPHTPPENIAALAEVAEVLGRY